MKAGKQVANVRLGVVIVLLIAGLIFQSTPAILAAIALQLIWRED